MSVARHTSYNIIGAAIPVAVSLVTVPLYLKIIGLDRYGVLAICWLLVGYFNLFDFGLGRAVAQKIATLTEAPWQERNRIFWTGAVLSLCLSAVAAALFTPFASIGLGQMKVANLGLRTEIYYSVPLMIACVPLGIMQSLLSGSLEGRREFFKLNVILSLGSIATAVFPLLTATFLGPHLPNLLAASLITRIGVLILLVMVCFKAVPIRRPKIASAGEIRQLLRFGGWTTITNIAGPLLVFIDRFAIAAIVSAAAVALYVIPFNLVSQLSVIPAALAAALLPRLASAPDTEAVDISKKGLAVLTFLLTPLTLAMIIGVGPFLALWIGGPASLASTPVAYILLFGFWANALARIPFVRLQASGRPDLIAKTHAAEMIPYLILLYAGLKFFGIPGAALAWSARAAIDAVILYVLARFERASLRALLVHALVIIGAISIALIMPTWSPLRWLALGSILAIVTAALLRNPPMKIHDLLEQLTAKKRAQNLGV